MEPTLSILNKIFMLDMFDSIYYTSFSHFTEIQDYTTRPEVTITTFIVGRRGGFK